MIYNYIKSILYFFLSLSLLSSCVAESDEVFELSALERANQHQEECFNALVASEQGWIVEYFPEANNFGGYTFIMKFSADGRVIITPESGFQEESTNSTFRVHSGQSTVLSFDTYSALHHLADPEELKPEYKDQDLSEIELTESPFINYGSGYEGDFEFVCDSIASNYLEFKSLKRKTRVTFTQLKNSDTESFIKAQAIINDILELKAREGLFIQYQGLSIELTYDLFHRFTKYELDEMGFYTAAPMPFVITPNGIKLYNPIAIGDVEVSAFIWNAEEEVFKSEEGAVLVQGSSPRSEFANPVDYEIHWVNFELSSQAFMDDVKLLETDMRSMVDRPELFAGIEDIRFVMNAYPAAQEYYGGSHRIDVYSSVNLVRESNLYLIGTSALSLNELAFNYGTDFSDGNNGKVGYALFHSLVNSWLYRVLYKPNVYIVDVEERYSYGELYTTIKLTRKDNPDYYIILEQ